MLENASVGDARERWPLTEDWSRWRYGTSRKRNRITARINFMKIEPAWHDYPNRRGWWTIEFASGKIEVLKVGTSIKRGCLYVWQGNWGQLANMLNGRAFGPFSSRKKANAVNLKP